MTFSALQIAALINGKTEGDANISVNSFGKIEEAENGQLAFLANPKYEEYLYITRASVIIINEALELKQPITATLIRVPDAYTAFAKLLTTYQQMMQQQLTGVQEPVYISASASSIFPKELTEIFASPSVFPLISAAICNAEKVIRKASSYEYLAASNYAVTYIWLTARSS